MPRKISISPQILEKLYYEERLTQAEIADVLGCSATTIARRMREYGLPTSRDHEEYWKRVPDKGIRCHWTPEIAYAVGLIVTDGSLSLDGRHITFTSSDYQLVETFKGCLGLSNRITYSPPGSYTKRTVYRIQFSDVAFYEWLLGIGLMPNKSLRLGALNVPDEHFADFLRGHFDGDGCIYTYTDEYNIYKGKRYTYRRLYTLFSSSSQKHLKWLKDSLQRILGTHGGLHPSIRAKSEGISVLWRLKYAKKDSLRLLHWMYYSPDVPCLKRKRAIAKPFLARSLD